nr:hypothetical protein [Tanacetum cinerariifolium]
MGESYVSIPQRKKNGRMMLEFIKNGPLVYSTIEENSQVRDKKYAELTEQEKLQDDCDVQALNIVLQGNASSSRGNNAAGQARVVKCYNCRVKDIWQNSVLSQKGQRILHDPGIPDGQAIQTTIPQNTAFQTDDLDAYDSDCDYICLTPTKAETRGVTEN